MMTTSKLLPTGVAWISRRDFIDPEGAHAEGLTCNCPCPAFASTPLRPLPVFRQHHHARVPREMHPQGVERAHSSSPCGAFAPTEEPLKHVRQGLVFANVVGSAGNVDAEEERKRSGRSGGGRRRGEASRLGSRPQVGASPCRGARLAGTRGMEGSGRELLRELCETRKKGGSSLGVAHLDWPERPPSEDEPSASALGRPVRGKARNSVLCKGQPGDTAAISSRAGHTRTPGIPSSFAAGRRQVHPTAVTNPPLRRILWTARDCSLSSGGGGLHGVRAADELVQTHRVHAQGRQHQRREASALGTGATWMRERGKRLDGLTPPQQHCMRKEGGDLSCRALRRRTVASRE